MDEPVQSVSEHSGGVIHRIRAGVIDHFASKSSTTFPLHLELEFLPCRVSWVCMVCEELVAGRMPSAASDRRCWRNAGSEGMVRRTSTTHRGVLFLASEADSRECWTLTLRRKSSRMDIHDRES